MSTFSHKHVGDLGNIEADDDGKARFRFTDGLVKVRPLYFVVNSMLLIGNKS